MFEWLNRLLFQSELANIVQVLSGVAILYTWKRFVCKGAAHCIRPASHPVPRTTYRTCSKHATPAVYAELRARHSTERPAQDAAMNDDDA